MRKRKTDLSADEHKEAAAAFIETGAAKHLKNFPCDATKAPYVVH